MVKLSSTSRAGLVAAALCAAPAFSTVVEEEGTLAAREPLAPALPSFPNDLKLNLCHPPSCYGPHRPGVILAREEGHLDARASFDGELGARGGQEVLESIYRRGELETILGRELTHVEARALHNEFNSRSELEAREQLEGILGRELTDNEIRSFKSVMGKIGGFAKNILGSFIRRDDLEDILIRSSDETLDLQTREQLEDILGRELTDNEIRSFKSVMGKIGGFAKNILGSFIKRDDLEDIHTRSSDEALHLQTREALEDILGRELTENEVRSFKSVMGKIGGFAKGILGSILKREDLEEILSRSSDDGFHLQTREQLEDILGRELTENEVRSFKSVLGKIGGVAKGILGSFIKRDDLEDILSRDFDDIDEFEF